MERSRSPNYPAIPLDQAIDLVGQIHAKSRTNVIDRASAAKDMGYSGLTGRSIAMLGALSQYELVDKAGKGDLRVSQTAVDILHGLTDADKKTALLRAGRSPKLFKSIFDRFTDGVPSENVIRSFLVQQGYANAAINPALKAFSQTNRFLEASAVYDSDGPSEPETPTHDASGENKATFVAPPAAVKNEGYRVMEGERVVFSEETGAEQYLKLVASGPLDDSLLEALEDYIRRQRKRLGPS